MRKNFFILSILAFTFALLPNFTFAAPKNTQTCIILYEKEHSDFTFAVLFFIASNAYSGFLFRCSLNPDRYREILNQGGRIPSNDVNLTHKHLNKIQLFIEGYLLKEEDTD
jgi:hypothetical protein